MNEVNTIQINPIILRWIWTKLATAKSLPAPEKIRHWDPVAKMTIIKAQAAHGSKPLDL